MLELVILLSLYQTLSGQAEAKGRSPYFGCLAPILWLTCEVLGAVAVTVALVLTGHGAENHLVIYGGGIAGGVVGGILAWIMVQRLPPAAVTCPSCDATIGGLLSGDGGASRCESCGADFETRGGEVSRRDGGA